VNGEAVPYQADPHPAAEAHAEFVQFGDGSSWGNADAATNEFGLRQKTLAELDLLEHFYEQGGESAFLDELAKADDLFGVIYQLKRRCENKAAYVNCTHERVRQTLATAREHEAALNAAAGMNNDQR